MLSALLDMTSVIFPQIARTQSYIEGILPKGPYLPCVSMAGRAHLTGYPQYADILCVFVYV